MTSGTRPSLAATGRLLAAGLVASFLSASPAATAGEGQRLVELLALIPGSRVADVGAGDGDWSVRLADAVGPSGHVWATEVEMDLVADLERRVADAKLGNVTVTLGSQTDTGLPAGCCDAILLRMVYHHFQDPVAMRNSLFDALVPAGRLAVVDINPQRHWRRLEGTPDRGGHGILPDDLVAEMLASGFELVALEEDWNGDDERYCAIFRRSDYQATP